MPDMATPLVNVKGLKVHYPLYSTFLRRHIGTVKAVDGLDFYIDSGETLALVGESGCGKSSTGQALLRLLEPSAGHIVIDGHNVTSLNAKELRKIRPKAQMIFQNPQESLNSRMTLASLIREPLDEHKKWNSTQKRQRVYELMDAVSLDRSYANYYPHMLSGGQRQRIAIARALALKPRFIICDEPIAALDISIQAQIINLLKDLQKSMGIAYLFISHDLSIVRYIADRVAVMSSGHIIEIAPTEELYQSPKHPYTRSLLSAIPSKGFVQN